MLIDCCVLEARVPAKASPGRHCHLGSPQPAYSNPNPTSSEPSPPTSQPSLPSQLLDAKVHIQQHALHEVDHQHIYYLVNNLLASLTQIRTHARTCATPTTKMKPPSKNAILLSDVQSLTLRGSGALTTHRRVPAAPQLKCISHPDVCALHDLETMRCVNQGSGYDSEDIQWSCTASLPAELKLGSTDVICEGYSKADDPYVLKGSCGVEYRLALTDKGEEKYPDIGRGRGGGRQGDGASDPSAWLFGILFVAVAGWIIYSACTAPRRNRGHRLAAAGGRRGGGGGGGGGGGWGPGGGGGGGDGTDSWDDPPPPYPGNSKTSRSGQQQQGGGAGGGWRPGFWSGILGGAAAGYAAGNRGNRNNTTTGNNGGWGGNNRNYGTNNGSGSGGGWGGSSSSSSRSNSGSSWGAASGPRHESTGFGGTSRR